jgi:hypothetical protein
VNPKLTRGLNRRATHENTLVMRRSPGDDEHQDDELAAASEGAARDMHGMKPDAAMHALATCLLRDGATHGALVILKTASRGDLARGFESHALRSALFGSIREIIR